MKKIPRVLLFFFLPLALGAQEPPLLGGAPEKASQLVFSPSSDGFFLGESSAYLRLHPRSSQKEDILWMRGQALLRLGRTAEAKTLFYGLTNSPRAEIRHRALLDLSQLYLGEGNEPAARDSLDRIRTDPSPSSVHEIAAARSLLMKSRLQARGPSAEDLSAFAALYPNSPSLSELYYYAAVEALNGGRIAEAERYAPKITGRKSEMVQRLLAEIALQKQDYAKAKEAFLPLAERGLFQDEALYKSALIFKLEEDYTNAALYFRRLTDNFPESMYAPRARAEGAQVNILLKNYEPALAYYRWESGFTGGRKAEALLKITEIYFVKKDSRSTVRAARRVQKDFPYSSYANEALYWLGRTSLNDKQFTRGIEIFNSYLIREPLSPKRDEIRIFLGQAHSGLGDQREARRHYQLAAKESSDSATVQNALLGIARSYTLEDQHSRALEYYDQVWKRGGPLGEQALYLSGASRYNLRQNKEAAENFQKLLKDYPQSRFRQDALLALARLDFKAENFENIASIKPAENTDSEGLSELKELQARSEFRLERFESALAGFREARQLTKNKERQTSLVLAEAGSLRNLGRHREAVRLYEQYLSDFGGENIEEIVWNEIILTTIEAGELEKAAQNLENFRKNFAKSAYLSGLYFKLADERYNQKRFADAATLYREARLSGSKNASAEAALREGWSMDALGRSAEAEEAFRIYLRGGSSGEVLGKLAEYRDAAGDGQAARLLREDILRKFPENSEAERARVFLAAAIPLSESDAAFRTAAAQSKDRGLKAKILYRLALKYENAGSTGPLLGVLWEIRQMKDPILGGEAALKMGTITLKEGDARGALNIFISVITDYENKTPEALLGIVESYLALGDGQNALRFGARLGGQYPGSTPAKKAAALLKNIDASN